MSQFPQAFLYQKNAIYERMIQTRTRVEARVCMQLFENKSCMRVGRQTRTQLSLVVKHVRNSRWWSNACATLVGRQTRAQLSLVVKRVRNSRWSSNTCATLVGRQTRAQLSLVVKHVRNSRWSSNTCATLVNSYLDWVLLQFSGRYLLIRSSRSG